MDAPSLEVFKARSDGALGSLVSIRCDADGIDASVLQPPVELCVSWAPHARISVGRVWPSCGLGVWSLEAGTRETPFLLLWVAAVQVG